MTELPHLESLEIGDCVEWTEASDYEAVGQLSHLKHLRLEQGPQTSVLQHLESSLKGMPNLQHLEFVNFTIDAPLDALQFSGLKRLLVIPCYSAEVKIFKLVSRNRNNLFFFPMQTLSVTMRHLFDCVVSMPHLQQLSWVVSDEILSTTADSKLPLSKTEDDGTESDASVTLDELQDLLQRRLSQTNVHLLRLPEYAAHRYSLSLTQED